MKYFTEIIKIVGFSCMLALLSFTSGAQGHTTYAAHRDKARTLNDAANYAEAIKHYDSAIANMPYSNQLLIERGMAHMAAGKFENAIADFNKVLQREPYKENVKALREEALAKHSSASRVPAEAPAAPQANSENASEPDHSEVLREWRRQQRNQLIWAAAVPMVLWSTWWWLWY